MPLMTIFYIVSGVCVLGILIALWLFQQESLRTVSGIQKVSPDDLKNYDPKTETIRERQGGTATQAPPAQSKKTKKPRVSLQGLFGSKKGQEVPVRLDAIEAAPDEPEKKKKKSLFGSFGKSKPSPIDDIPKPTTFPGLQKEEPSKMPPEQGTASMTTHKPATSGGVPGQKEKSPPPIPPSMGKPPPEPQPVLPIEQEVEQTKSAAGGHKDASSKQREHLATVQLDEWKVKYERLDKLFQEKSSHFAQAESQLSNERQNREDFFKLKTLLENELQEVKDRARDLQHTLKNAQMETEQQKVQAQQLRDKVRILEDEIQRKDSQMKDTKPAAEAPQDPPQGLPLSKLIDQNEREEAAGKDGSPGQNPMVNLPQDPKSNDGGNNPQAPSSAEPPEHQGPPPPSGGPDSQSKDKRF